MSFPTPELVAPLGPRAPQQRIEPPRIHRARCVLACQGRYLLAQHCSKRPENAGKWGLPGGRLKKREKPKAGLRRELQEELLIEAPRLVALGDWRHRGEIHRVFGCELVRRVETFDTDELIAIAWYSYDDVEALTEQGQLHTGFELAAISEYRRRFAL